MSLINLEYSPEKKFLFKYIGADVSMSKIIGGIGKYFYLGLWSGVIRISVDGECTMISPVPHNKLQDGIFHLDGISYLQYDEGDESWMLSLPDGKVVPKTSEFWETVNSDEGFGVWERNRQTDTFTSRTTGVTIPVGRLSNFDKSWMYVWRGKVISVFGGVSGRYAFHASGNVTNISFLETTRLKTIPSNSTVAGVTTYYSQVHLLLIGGGKVTIASQMIY